MSNESVVLASRRAVMRELDKSIFGKDTTQFNFALEHYYMEAYSYALLYGTEELEKLLCQEKN